MGVLVTDKVVKRFEGHTALDEVSIDLPKGSIYGLLGPNGAGKTTLLRIINQITAPDSGKVYLDGRPLVAEDILNIGYLPEERGLYKKMKVGEQALYLARLKGMSRDEAVRSLKAWFVRFNIQGWWNRKVGELSKGMAQKVQFIITVLHNPRLLILDEPFSGFDPVNVEIITRHILQLRDQGVSVLLSTHNMESVEELCDNIALINNARLIVQGKVGEIRKRYNENKLEVLYRAEAPLAQASSELYTPVSQERTEEGYCMILQKKAGVSTNAVLGALMDRVQVCGVKEVLPRMRDIFIRLVTDNR